MATASSKTCCHCNGATNIQYTVVEASVSATDKKLQNKFLDPPDRIKENKNNSVKRPAENDIIRPRSSSPRETKRIRGDLNSSNNTSYNSSNTTEPDMDINISAITEQDLVSVDIKKSSKTPNSNKPSGNNPNLPFTVYIKGTTRNIITYMTHHDKTFMKEFVSLFGHPHQLKYLIHKQSILVECISNHQLANILKAKRIEDIDIEVSLPFAIQRKTNPKPKNPTCIQPSNDTTNQTATYKCVIKGLSTAYSNEEILALTKCTYVRRFIKKEGDILIPLTTVLLSYINPYPQYISIDHIQFKTYPYIPKPLICTKCQNFGHHYTQCKKTNTVCSHCGASGHPIDDCPDKTHRPKCVHCHGSHPSNSTECRKYKETKQALEIRAKSGKTFKEALLTIKTNEAPVPSQLKISKPLIRNLSTTINTNDIGTTTNEQLNILTTAVVANTEAVNSFKTELNTIRNDQTQLQQRERAIVVFFSNCLLKIFNTLTPDNEICKLVSSIADFLKEYGLKTDYAQKVLHQSNSKYKNLSQTE
jgi:hypothetical protein